MIDTVEWLPAHGELQILPEGGDVQRICRARLALSVRRHTEMCRHRLLPSRDRSTCGCCAWWSNRLPTRSKQDAIPRRRPAAVTPLRACVVAPLRQRGDGKNLESWREECRHVSRHSGTLAETGDVGRRDWARTNDPADTTPACPAARRKAWRQQISCATSASSPHGLTPDARFPVGTAAAC